MPYGTSYWQVGDSPEQNGNYKIYLGDAKVLLTNEKTAMGLPMEVDPHNIITILNYAWKRSFALTKNNKVAIAKRGWFPLN